MLPSQEAKMKEILAQSPFKRVIKGIRKIESLYGTAAESGNTFKLFAKNGKAYKLNYAEDLLTAKRIEKNVKRFQHIFPKFYGREKRHLLFDWLKGRELTKKENLEVYVKLGQMCADIHKANISSGRYEEWDVEKYFTKRLNKIRESILSPKEKEKINKKYKELKNRIKFDIVVEINDIHAKNFMIDKNQNIFLVDEDGMDHRIKGLGFAKPLLNWFKKEQKMAFFQGYQEKHHLDYFDKDYKDLITIIECVRAIRYRSETGKPLEKYSKELKKLKELCNL